MVSVSFTARQLSLYMGLRTPHCLTGCINICSRWPVESIAQRSVKHRRARLQSQPGSADSYAGMKSPLSPRRVAVGQVLRLVRQTLMDERKVVAAIVVQEPAAPVDVPLKLGEHPARLDIATAAIGPLAARA